MNDEVKTKGFAIPDTYDVESVHRSSFRLHRFLTFVFNGKEIRGEVTLA